MLLKEGQKERQKGREDDEEDVSSYWITLRKRYWNLMETLDPLFGEVALEEDMDQSQDRIRDDEWVTDRNVAKLYFAFVKCRV